jgi:hypothetical protein
LIWVWGYPSCQIESIWLDVHRTVKRGDFTCPYDSKYPPFSNHAHLTFSVVIIEINTFDLFPQSEPPHVMWEWDHIQLWSALKKLTHLQNEQSDSLNQILLLTLWPHDFSLSIDVPASWIRTILMMSLRSPEYRHVTDTCSACFTMLFPIACLPS